LRKSVIVLGGGFGWLTQPAVERTNRAVATAKVINGSHFVGLSFVMMCFGLRKSTTLGDMRGELWQKL
jgi:hypothetical protein